MEYDVEAKSPVAKELAKKVMPSIIKQLGLEKSRKAVLIKITDDVEPGFEGSTMNIEVADCMLVLIKDPNAKSKSSLLNMVLTISHEMVHVRQLAKGMLKFLPNGDRIWKGKFYSGKTHYLEQPWEVDAFTRQELVCRRAIEL